MQINKFFFTQHGDTRGELVAIESGKDIPFEIKRIYYVYQTKDGVSRGHHSHKSLEQILICVNGSCRVTLDNGRERESIVLDKAWEGIYVGPNTWREMDEFSDGAVLLVLASEPYNENDYIRDYNLFLESVR